MKIAPTEAHDCLTEYLESLEGYAEVYLKFHSNHKAEFLEMPASIKSHHSFVGGYAVHIAEVVQNMVALTKSSLMPDSKRPSLGEAIIAAYIHDIDKLLMRYVRDTDGPTDPQRKKAMMEGIKMAPDETKASLSKKIDAAVNGKPIPNDTELPRHVFNPAMPSVDDSAAVMFLCNQHGLPGITWDIVHAVSLHHGGYSALARTSPYIEASPLAILLHAADQISAGIQQGDV